jgi:hypothetical protein
VGITLFKQRPEALPRNRLGEVVNAGLLWRSLWTLFSSSQNPRWPIHL